MEELAYTKMDKFPLLAIKHMKVVSSQLWAFQSSDPFQSMSQIPQEPDYADNQPPFNTTVNMIRH